MSCLQRIVLSALRDCKCRSHLPHVINGSLYAQYSKDKKRAKVGIAHLINPGTDLDLLQWLNDVIDAHAKDAIDYDGIDLISQIGQITIIVDFESKEAEQDV